MNSTRTERVSMREIAIHGAILVALLAVVFPGTFLRGEMISPGALVYMSPPWNAHVPAGCTPPANRLAGDALAQFHLWYTLVRHSLDAGEWPLWNPTQMGGMPLLANVQSTPFYPPRLLHAFLDLHLATTLYILLKLWLCGATAYVCARALRLGVPAARFFSVAWMLSSFNLTWSYWPIPDVAAWMPVAFLGAEFLLDQRYRRGFFTLALGGTLLLFAGHPETAFAFGAGLGLYFVLRLAWDRRRGRALWAPVGLAAAAWALALSTFAVVLLPFAEYLPNSLTFSSHGVLGRSEFSFPLSELAVLWVPRFYGMSHLGNYRGFWNSNFGVMIYSGMGVWLALSLLSGARGEARKERAKTLCLLIAAAFFLLVAFDIPAFASLKALPVIRSMWHFYFVTFALFAVPLGAARALDGWLSSGQGPRALVKPGLGLAIMLLIPVALHLAERASLDAQAAAFTQRQILLAGLWAVLGVTVLVLGAKWRHKRAAAVALTAILALDLLMATRGLHPTAPRAWLYPKTALTDYLVGLEQPARLCVATAGLADELRNGVLEAYGLEQSGGYDGIYPGRVFRFLDEGLTKAGETLEPLYAISHYLYPAGTSAANDAPEVNELLGTFDGIAVCRNKRALPRAFLVGHTEFVASTEALFERMRAPGFAPALCAVTEEPPGAPLPEAKADALGTARVARRGAMRMQIDVDAAQACVLVVADAFYPGWRAYIDGESAELFPVYHAFRGVIVPEGRHVIEQRYEPASFRAGLALSSVVLGVSALASAILALRGRRDG